MESFLLTTRWLDVETIGIKIAYFIITVMEEFIKKRFGKFFQLFLGVTRLAAEQFRLRGGATALRRSGRTAISHY